MVSLQNNYQIRLSTLKKTEMQILRDLQQQKQRRDRALKIMHAEKSHQSWAMTKLDYTINVAKHYNETREHRQESAHDAELKEDKEFVSELETFLSNLRNISEHQKQIVNEDEQSINDLESRLLQIRYDMNKVRTLTFKKIYDLHKQVQIAESLELGYRRLSVASATEIERERRHHSIKIQRQLHTLNAQIKAFNYKLYEKNFREIIDIEIIMSNSKLKAFFGVYLQTAAQTIIDIELSYNNLNASLPPIDGGTSNLVVNDLYGIETVVNSVKIRLNAESDMIEEEEQSLNDKLTKCYKFLKKIKKAIKMERQKAEDHDKEEEEEEEEEKYHENERRKPKTTKQVKTFHLNNVLLIVARKLCLNARPEIEHQDLSQIPRFAEAKMIEIFDAILNGNKIFKPDPVSPMDAATQILRQVLQHSN